MSFNEVLLNMSKECSNFTFRGQAVQEIFLDCPSNENEGTVYLGNVRNYSHPRTPEFSTVVP
jgi:hypothetical protein